jgi:hypothetical protein
MRSAWHTTDQIQIHCSVIKCVWWRQVNFHSYSSHSTCWTTCCINIFYFLWVRCCIDARSGQNESGLTRWYVDRARGERHHFIWLLWCGARAATWICWCSERIIHSPICHTNSSHYRLNYIHQYLYVKYNSVAGFRWNWAMNFHLLYHSHLAAVFAIMHAFMHYIHHTNIWVRFTNRICWVHSFLIIYRRDERVFFLTCGIACYVPYCCWLFFQVKLCRVTI